MDKKFERLAELKSIIKGLEAEAKTIQDELLEVDSPAEKASTPYGTLTLTVRETHECPDNKRLFDELGHADYIAVSTVSPGAITKKYGELRTAMLKSVGLITLKSVSRFYTLRK